LSSPAALGDLIPAGAQVYWGDDARESWFLLKRANYLGRAQGSAVVFSRAMSLEMVQHENAVDELTSQRNICRAISGAMATCTLSGDAVLDGCVASNAPDYMVFEHAVGLTPIAVRTLAVPGKPKPIYIYSCALLSQQHKALNRSESAVPS